MVNIDGRIKRLEKRINELYAQLEKSPLKPDYYQYTDEEKYILCYGSKEETDDLNNRVKWWNRSRNMQL